MRTVILALAGVFVVVLQGSVLSMLPVFGAQIDILLLIILSMALVEQNQAPVLFGIVYGALLDILYSPRVGFYAVAYLAASGVAVFSLKRLPRINIATVLLSGFLGSLIAQCICLILAYAIGSRFTVTNMFSAHIFPQALLTGAFMLPAYFFASRIAHPKFRTH